MNAQALNVPVTFISVPALLVAAAGTAAAVSLAVLVLDERTLVEVRSAAAEPTVSERYNPGNAYAEQLQLRRGAYLNSLRD